VGKGLTGAQYVVKGMRESNLILLCGSQRISASSALTLLFNAENAENRRGHREMLLTDPQRTHNMRTLSKCVIGVVLVHT